MSTRLPHGERTIDMTATMLDKMFEECLRNCTECHTVCFQTAVSPQVAAKISPDDLKLLLNCSDICRTSADFLAVRSAFHRIVCRTCSEICAACAEMCERSGIDVMLTCAKVCRTCEDSCRRMAEMA